MAIRSYAQDLMHIQAQHRNTSPQKNTESAMESPLSYRDMFDEESRYYDVKKQNGIRNGITAKDNRGQINYNGNVLPFINTNISYSIGNDEQKGKITRLDNKNNLPTITKTVKSDTGVHFSEWTVSYEGNINAKSVDGTVIGTTASFTEKNGVVHTIYLLFSKLNSNPNDGSTWQVSFPDDNYDNIKIDPIKIHFNAMGQLDRTSEVKPLNFDNIDGNDYTLYLDFSKITNYAAETTVNSTSDPVPVPVTIEKVDPTPPPIPPAPPIDNKIELSASYQGNVDARIISEIPIITTVSFFGADGNGYSIPVVFTKSNNQTHTGITLQASLQEKMLESIFGGTGYDVKMNPIEIQFDANGKVIGVSDIPQIEIRSNDGKMYTIDLDFNKITCLEGENNVQSIIDLATIMPTPSEETKSIIDNENELDLTEDGKKFIKSLSPGFNPSILIPSLFNELDRRGLTISVIGERMQQLKTFLDGVLQALQDDINQYGEGGKWNPRHVNIIRLMRENLPTDIPENNVIDSKDNPIKYEDDIIVLNEYTNDNNNGLVYLVNEGKIYVFHGRDSNAVNEALDNIFNASDNFFDLSGKVPLIALFITKFKNAAERNEMQDAMMKYLSTRDNGLTEDEKNNLITAVSTVFANFT